MANFNEQTAKEFLQRTMTVVGSSAAIEDQNGTFLKKYATVVNSKDAIKIVAPETTGSTGAKTGSTSEQGQTGSTGAQTGSTGAQTGSTGAQTGSTSEQGATDSTDAGAGEGTDVQAD
jgi:hypothetical protein